MVRQCLGTLVSDGHVIVVDNSTAPYFALSSSTSSSFSKLSFKTNPHLKIGYLSVKEAIQYDQVISGHGYLVHEGKSFIKQSTEIEHLNHDFSTEMAPRTALGADQHGNILVAELDGNERIYQGISLSGWADFLVDIGFYEAINLDGGGSATDVLNGKVVNKCSDPCLVYKSWKYLCPGSILYCQRPVTSIICVK